MNLAARFDVFAHERGEDGLGFGDVFELDRQQGAALRVHGGLPELLGGHFAQTFVAGFFVPAGAGFLHVLEELAQVSLLDDLGLGFALASGLGCRLPVVRFLSLRSFLFASFACLLPLPPRLRRQLAASFAIDFDHERRFHVGLDLLELGEQLAVLGR